MPLKMPTAPHVAPTSNVSKSNGYNPPGRDQNGNSKPVKSFRIGLVTVSIWKRTGQHGDFYNTSVQRSYKDGENWKYSDSFGRDDLLAASKLLDLAHSWVITTEAETRAE